MLLLFIKGQLGNLVNKEKEIASLDRLDILNHCTLTSVYIM
jgi:hypothetical protein